MQNMFCASPHHEAGLMGTLKIAQRARNAAIIRRISLAFNILALGNLIGTTGSFEMGVFE